MDKEKIVIEANKVADENTKLTATGHNIATKYFVLGAMYALKELEKKEINKKNIQQTLF